MQYRQGRRKVGAWEALAPPMFGRTVNPISTRGADYVRHSTTSPPKFSDLATALPSIFCQKASFCGNLGLLEVYATTYCN